MSTTLKRIDAVVLFVADVERAKLFYRDTLGLALNFEDEASAAFDFDNTLLILLNIAGAQDLLSSDDVAAQPPTAARSLHVSFVEDVDAVYTDLAGRGVQFVREPVDRPWGLRTAHFKDPDGNIWELSQSLTAASDEG